MLKHFVNQKEVHSVKTKQDQSWGRGQESHTRKHHDHKLKLYSIKGSSLLHDTWMSFGISRFFSLVRQFNGPEHQYQALY